MASKTIESANAPAKPPGNTANPTEGLQSFATVQAHEQTQMAVEPQNTQGPGRGRPSHFDPIVFDEICEELASGKTLLQICRDESKPGASTVRRWVQKGSKEIRAKYADARALGIETLADEIVEIADDSSGDEKEIETQNGGSYTILNKEFAERSKIRIDARKWMLSKLAAHTYGDKIEQTITGNMTTKFTLSVGDGSVQQRQEKPANAVTFDLPAKSADEIIEENL